MNLLINEELRTLIPPLQEEEFNLLEKSIIKEGCRDSLITWNNTIIDGHNRYKICKEHDIKFSTVEMEFDNLSEVKKFMIDNQLARRNLTDSQRRYFIGKRQDEENLGRGGDRKSNCQDVTLKQTARNIAKDNNISERQVYRNSIYSKAIDKIKEEQPEFAEEILSEKVRATNKEVIELANQEVEQRTNIIEMLKRGKTKTIKEADTELKNKKKKEEFEKQIEEIRNTAVVMPTGKYQAIVLDPPWDYGTKYSPTGRRVANPYPEMSQEELKDLEILSEDDSIMFLWTTQRFIWNAKELLEHWGFEYRSMIVWDKEQMGMGDLLRMQCEFCLIGIKGKPILNNPNNIRDIIREPRREHSRKPEAFYNIVNTLCVGSKIEYFSRTERDGWASFGNEKDKFKGGI